MKNIKYLIYLVSVYNLFFINHLFFNYYISSKYNLDDGVSFYLNIDSIEMLLNIQKIVYLILFIVLIFVVWKRIRFLNKRMIFMIFMFIPWLNFIFPFFLLLGKE